MSETMPLAVIIDGALGDVAEERGFLEPRGIKVEFFPRVGAAGLAAAAGRAAAVAVNLSPLDAGFIAGLERCRVIARYGIGYDNVDVKAASAKKIMVANVPGYCPEEVSEHAAALIFALARKVPFLDRGARAGVWEVAVERPIVRLAGKTAGVVGMGMIGKGLARRLVGAGMEVVFYDPFVKEDNPDGIPARRVELDELLARAAAVSLHLPLNDQTRHIIDAAAIGKMRPGAFLVNTSRGGLIDEPALARALKEKRLGGAGLDVLEGEATHELGELADAPNLILTPHAGWLSEDSLSALRLGVAAALAAGCEGGRPTSVVN